MTVQEPLTTVFAVKTAGEFSIGLFDEGGQLELPGGFDDAGRMTKVSVKKFLLNNIERINQKIGKKLGKVSGDLPFEKSKEGFEKAIKTIEETLENPSVVTEPFTNARGQNEVFDVFSEKTGMTVRVKTDGTFDTLIPQPTDIVKKVQDEK